jgi:hypothetical protein
MEFNKPVIKAVWLCEGVSLRDDGVVLIIIPLIWRTICKYFQPMGNKHQWQGESSTLDQLETRNHLPNSSWSIS